MAFALIAFNSLIMAIDKSALASQIKGTILVEGDEGYDEQIKRWAENAEKKAGYVVLVENEEDISKTVIDLTYRRLI